MPLLQNCCNIPQGLAFMIFGTILDNRLLRTLAVAIGQYPIVTSK
jgi:hypothetical protein